MANGRYGHHQGNRGGGRGGDTLPRPQPVTYFRNDNLDPALVDEVAQDWAERIKSLKPTQLRRFFDEVRAIERQFELEAQKKGDREAAFAAVRPRFKMLKARAAYAKGRLGRNMPDDFLQFMVNHTHAVQTARDFDAFLKHFEAVVAFHKYLSPER